MAKLGKFEIQEQLGHGGMGVVYRAWDSRMERWVALKTMAPDKAVRAEFIKRFKREALSAGRLDHPNIVTIYEFDEQDDVCYIAMQFLEGSDLESLLSSARWEKEFPIFRKLDTLIQVCQGLSYAHRNGVVHRDVKPANIMILPDGTAKLVDFGIARIGEGTSGTQNMLLGTAPYMSPEQVEGRTTDERVDVFAVGVIGYRMFAGHFPFEAPNLSSILYKIVHDPPPALSTYLSEYPPDLERILFTALAKDREQRYRTMEEMSFELQGLLSSLNTSLIASYIEEARRLVLLHDFGRAKDLLRKVLEKEPGNPGATALWQQVQKLLQQEFTKRKVQKLMSDGIEAYERGDWLRALDCFEQGLQQEPGHEMLQTYRNLTLREQEKIQAISENLKGARESLQRRDLPSARERLLKVLDLNPENTEAGTLLSEVDAELAEIEKRRNAQQYLDRAQQARTAQQYGEALSLLDKAQALDPENPQANRLRSVVLAEQAEAEHQKVRAEKIAAAQAALERSDFAAALQQAEVGLHAFANDPALQQLQARANQGLEAARRRKQLDEQLELARTLVNQGDLAGARKILSSARERDPLDPRLKTLAQAISKLEEKQDRERLCEAELERARALMRDNKHDEARRVLLEARDRFGRTPPIQELLTFLTQEIKRLQQEREIQDLLRQAAEFTEAEAPEKAAQLLRKAVRKYNQPVITEELNKAAKLAKEAEDRRQLLDRASELMRKKLWGQARSLLADAPEGCRRLPRYRELWEQVVAASGPAAPLSQDAIPTGVVNGETETAGPAVRMPAAPAAGAAAAVAPTRAPSRVVEKPRETPRATPLPATLPPWRRWPPALRSAKTWYVLAAAVLATAMGIVLAGRFASRQVVQPAVQTSGAPPSGILRLDVTPWAEIKEVRNLATGARQAVPGQTPIELSLPAGEYRIVVAHPKFGELGLSVRVEAAGAKDVRQAFPAFDVEQLLKKYE